MRIVSRGGRGGWESLLTSSKSVVRENSSADPIVSSYCFIPRVDVDGNTRSQTNTLTSRACVEFGFRAYATWKITSFVHCVANQNRGFL